jgi:hypothetical protein
LLAVEAALTEVEANMRATDAEQLQTAGAS